MGTAGTKERELSMRVVLRIAGALFLALAMILLIADGTRMLAANEVFATPLDEVIGSVLPGALDAAEESVTGTLHPLLWDPVITTLLSWPGWAVFGVLGIVLALLGRSRSNRRLVSIDQF